MKELCLSMLKELSQYKGHSKEDLLYKYIKERLDSSFSSYIDDMDTSVSYLGRRKELNVIKKINKHEKQPKN